LSNGGSTEGLMAWTQMNHINLNIKKDGIYLSTTLTMANRPSPKKIYAVNEIVAVLIDKLAVVYPGNHLTMNDFVKKGMMTSISFTLSLDKVTPLNLELIGKQLKDLPLMVHDITLNAQKGNSYNGSITMEALGS
jgi:hypothetical protein